VTIPLSRVLAPSGEFTLSPRLPPKLLPGSYVLTASARLDGSRLPPATQRVVVPAPPEGVIARAYMSATSGGRAVESLPLTTKRFYAHFVFAPAGRTKFPLTVEWYGPRGTFIGRKGKPNAARVDSFVAFPPGMSEARKAGTWGCILRAGGVIVRNLFVRLE
jgi:hypothetical protein